MNSLFFFAAEATGASTEPENWWKIVAMGALGMLLMRLATWAAQFITGTGSNKLVALLGKLQEKVNENSIAAQVTADDAIIKILQHSIPDVMAVLADKLKEDLKDGKLNAENWSTIGSQLWEAAKPHIIGGKNDYLKNSSFADGKAIATLVAKRFFSKKEEGGNQ